jgi:chromate transporter
MVLVNLFLAFLRISLFAVGGAYSFLPLIEKEVVQKYHWLTKEEFLDVAGITQILPGAISIKYATYTGYKIGGVFGVLSANLGNILAPALLIILVSVFYTKYKDSAVAKAALDSVRLAIFAMIIAMALELVDIHNLLEAKKLLIIILSFVIFFYTKAYAPLVIIMAAVLGIIWR